MQLRLVWKLLICITWNSFLVATPSTKALKSNLVPFLLAEESCMCHALEALLAAGNVAWPGWEEMGSEDS